MKFLVVLTAALACASGKPGAPAVFGYTAFNGFPAATAPLAPAAFPAPAPAFPAPAPYAAPAPFAYAAPPAPLATRYHAQDELGQASYGYAHPGQAHSVARDAAGNERGSYAYVNPAGQEIRVDYTAGLGGFQAASNALPVAPADTPEVQAAKAAHFAAKGALPPPPPPAPPAPFQPLAAAPLAGPLPVADTPEVQAAKAAHFAAHAEANARAGRKKRGAPLAAGYTPAATAPLAIAAGPAPFAYATGPAFRPALLTTIHNNPGFAVSYRVD